MRLNSLHDVLAQQLEDLYSAEQQLVQALPRMAGAAHTNELRVAFEEHLGETRQHVQRLADLLPTVGIQTPTETCKGMEGLIREGEEIVTADGDPKAKDAALIGAAQRIEHYEIAAYGTAATLADELDLEDAKELLGQTLDEEETADRLLTKIATGGMFRAGINEQAAT